MATCEPIDVALDVDGVRPDARSVDGLARLALLAARHGWRLVLTRASAELLELIDLMGLAEVLAEQRSGASQRS